MLQTAWSVTKLTTLTGVFFTGVGMVAAPAVAPLTLSGIGSTALTGVTTSAKGVAVGGEWISSGLTALTS